MSRSYLGRRKLAALLLALCSVLSVGSAVTIDRAAAINWDCGIKSSGQYYIYTEWRKSYCDWIAYGSAGIIAQDPTGQFKAVFDATGRLYVQRWDGLVTWEPGTYAPNARITFQYDGNVVIYRQNGQPYWGAYNYFGAYGPMRFVMQTDGNLVTYNGNWKAYWSSFSGTLYS